MELAQHACMIPLYMIPFGSKPFKKNDHINIVYYTTITSLIKSDKRNSARRVIIGK